MAQVSRIRVDLPEMVEWLARKEDRERGAQIRDREKNVSDDDSDAQVCKSSPVSFATHCQPRSSFMIPIKRAANITPVSE